MTRNFFQGTDAEIAAGAAHFVTVVTTANEATYGLLTADLTAFAAANSAFQAAYAVAINPTTRTSAAIRGKDDCRAGLIRAAQSVALKINGTQTVTDQMKMDVGIKPRAVPATIGIPTAIPVIDVLKTLGNKLSVNVRQADKTKRGKPAGVYGVQVYSFVGNSAPADINLWRLEGATTRTQFEIEFPITLAPFTKVWLTALYTNPRLQAGPASTPMATNLGTWGVQNVATTADGTLKIAA